MNFKTQLETLAKNLWWSWDDRTAGLWNRLSAERWSSSLHNPVAFLASTPEADFQAWAGDAELVAEVAEHQRPVEDGVFPRHSNP